MNYDVNLLQKEKDQIADEQAEKEGIAQAQGTPSAGADEVMLELKKLRQEVEYLRNSPERRENTEED